jgi:hypothetical protein
MVINGKYGEVDQVKDVMLVAPRLERSVNPVCRCELDSGIHSRARLRESSHLFNTWNTSADFPLVSWITLSLGRKSRLLIDHRERGGV